MAACCHNLKFKFTAAKKFFRKWHTAARCAPLAYALLVKRFLPCDHGRLLGWAKWVFAPAGSLN